MAYRAYNIIFCLFFISTIIILVYLNANISISYAHISQEDNTFATIQEWKDKQNEIKIQFSYSPEKPLIYNTTNLVFSRQNLNTGSHIKDLLTDITVTKGDKIFVKFDDITVEDGDLFLKIRFSEDGNYQVINHIRSKDNIAIALTSFNVLVPLQPFGKFNVDNLISLLAPAGLVAIALSASVIVLVIISRKGKGEPKEEEGQKEEEREKDK